MSNIAIIPARGGSKRIPRKNIRYFCGKPMIAWPIQKILDSNLFDKLIVSTDSQEIANVAKDYGAEIPFIRPPKLSDDFATTGDVIKHAIKTLHRKGEYYDELFCIYATNPFLDDIYLRKGHEIITKGLAPSAYTVTEFPSSIFRAMKINQKGELEMIWPEFKTSRTQDLTEAYMDAGQFYCARTDKYLEYGHFSMPGARPIILPQHLVHDIDTEDDWKTAERMFMCLKGDYKDK